MVLSAVRQGAVAQRVGAHIRGRGELEHGKRARREGEIANGVAGLVHHHEPVAPELERLLLAGRIPRRLAGKAVRAALRLPRRLIEKSAGQVERGLDVQVALTFPQLMEGDAPGVAEEPCRLVIERGDAALERADPECHLERPALRAE